MKCQSARECIVLLNYGELPDELAGVLEQHLAGCEDCREELDAFRGFEERLATMPVLEPSPNLLAQSRMRLDDALDMIPPHGFLTQLRMNFHRWIGHLQSAPALATLLLGVGFLAGNFTYRYQVAHAPKTPPVVTVNHPTEGVIANVTGIVQSPNSELVQVNYNKIVPESMEGPLDSQEIRNLLLAGTSAGATDKVRMHSVALLTDECKAGHACQPSADGKGLLHTLMVSLRYDQDAGVRMKALDGLQGIPTDIEPIFVTADELAPIVNRPPNAGPARQHPTLGSARVNTAIRSFVARWMVLGADRKSVV